MWTKAHKLARRKQRGERRATGMSWFCIIDNHALCSGYSGRLQSADVVRSTCPCPCHDDEEYQAFLENRDE